MNKQAIPFESLAAVEADAADLRQALNVLDTFPFAVLWIRHDRKVIWANRCARQGKDANALPLCHQLCYGYSSPCIDNGRPCPKTKAEAERVVTSVTHYRVVGRTLEIYQIVAIPLQAGGVLEMHIPNDDSMSRDQCSGLLARHVVEHLSRLALQVRPEAGWCNALLVLGIDRLTSMPIHFGSSAQTQALARVGAVIKSSVRGSDPAGIWMGEQILVAMPSIAPERAIGRAEHLVKTIRELSIAAAPDGSRLTASAGLTFCVDPHKPFDEDFDLALRMMYRARAKGGDRLEASSLPELSVPSPVGARRAA